MIVLFLYDLSINKGLASKKINYQTHNTVISANSILNPSGMPK